MSTYSQTIQAGGSWEIGVPGELFRIISASGPLNVMIKKSGIPIGEYVGILDGFWAKPDGGFNGVQISSETTQTVTVAVVSGDTGYDRAAGTVSIANMPASSGNFSNSQVTVTSASGQLIAGNSSRRYLMIQNKSSAGTVWVRFGAAATFSSGLKIPPGASYELTGYVPGNSVNAIGDIASNSDVVVVEG